MIWLYALASAFLFTVSSLPLEFNVLMVSLLLAEAKRHCKAVTKINGEFALNIEGGCRFSGQEYRVCKAVFFSRHLIVLDVMNAEGKRRLLLACDAFPGETFRHVSRVCLALKV